MSSHSPSATAPWGPAPAAPSATTRDSQLARRLFLDRLANVVVRGGGIIIIASILAILFVLFYEVYPLLKDPTRELEATHALKSQSTILAVDVDEYRETAFAVHAGGVDFIALDSGETLEVATFDLGGATIVSTSPLRGGPIALGLSDGRVVPIRVSFQTTFEAGKRMRVPSLSSPPPTVLDPAGRPVARIANVDAPRGTITAGMVSDREIDLISVTETTPMIGEPVREEARERLVLPESDAKATALALDDRGDNLFVGVSDGTIFRFSLNGGEKPTLAETVAVAEGSAVSTMGFLIGDRTLIVGTEDGAVSSWQLLRAAPKGERLTKVYEFEKHGSPVTALATSRRHKGFVTGARDGDAKLHFGTTGETLLDLAIESGGLSAVSFAPKADGVILASASGVVQDWAVHAPHPETTLRSLFGPVWYEGYDQPEYVWQSTGGTDDFEPKLSLTPLIYGTLKGTFYALVIAVPLALLGALYASQFMHPALKAYVKPTVEIMAALPSVVLGFIAGLWLAPAVESIVPGLFLLPFILTAAILAAAWLWRLMPGPVRHRIRPGTEVFLLIPLVIAAGWVSIQLGYTFERFMLAGDYRRWMLDVLGLTYDQRNSLVVGLAMGFAVIPIIFTIAEDSLSSVPNHLRAGSLALGATPWQTAIRVVLPTGSPGIFSAVMIGFGRAVGETMIVLMATGNTPVMEGSIFSGFRALSANIAVELPEAPEGGTLYRVLFLAALLLFFTTFVVNTAAELIRLRLRSRYRVL